MNLPTCPVRRTRTRIRSWVAGLLALLAAMTTPAEDVWPGAAPDCWPSARMVHGVANYESLWKDQVRLAIGAKTALRDGVRSSNGGYAFAIEKSGDKTTIRIDSEKTEHVLIQVSRAVSVHPVQWVNEKLIFGRIWWGRIAATDFIFDVETASFVWHQSATESSDAMAQYRQGCRQSGGCECLDRPAPQ